MARKERTVADRQKSLEPASPQASFTLAGVRMMYEGAGSKEYHCTISAYCRTQIFEFPRIDFHPDGEEPSHEIYASGPIRACVTSSLVSHFEDSKLSKHYAISPSLRHMVVETEERIRSQQQGHTPVFVVVEESNRLTPVQMCKGECNIWDEVIERNGEIEPRLIGGRKGKEFITAWATIDGAWPELPNNQLIVNMVLAGVRAGQKTSDPIRKYLDQSCLVTDDGHFVNMMRPTASARGTTYTLMDTTAYRARVSEISRGITAIKQDLGTPHVALLVNAMYRDEYKNDAYQRLQYLQLWQSMTEAGRRYLNYQGKSVKYDKVVVAGSKTLRELTEYRDDIAHLWTDTIDENFLADLQRTTIELLRQRYF